MRNKHSRKNTGQLAIFIILLFPVLFTLFAMSLNITLVVHDKINLQNSVDIAAYYGAMKQAEMLNAIAHINYQIRQSWKLLVWRYRVLGSVSLTHRPEWGNPALAVEREHWPQSLKNLQIGPYFFCVGHKDWGWFIKKGGGSVNIPRTREDKPTDMLCNEMGGRINAPSVPSFSGSLGSLSGVLRNISRAGNTIREQLEGKCKLYGYNSWLLGALSFSHFRADQTARKQMIYYLAKAMSGKLAGFPHKHGTDLNGDSIASGVKKTFERNLTYINGKAFKETPDNPFIQFNSLERVLSPSDWLEDTPFWALGLFADIHPVGKACEKNLKFLRQGSSVLSDKSLKSILLGEQDMNWPGCVTGNSLCSPSAGLHKKRNFLIFYSVKAELKYKCQIFLPWGCGDGGNVYLKAKAFAKPFGGTIGPIGPRSASLRGEDPLLPNPHGESPSGDLVKLDKKFTPNYSRYPGDKFGLRSSYVHYYWAEHIQRSPHDTKNIKFYLKGNHGDDRDPLARGIIPPGVKSLLARKWEIMAVAPDIFDVTYFTILPYYMQTYFPKIKVLLKNEPVNLRGGFGSYKAGNDFQWKYGILGQHKTITGQPPELRIDDLWFLSHYSAPRPRPPWYKIAKLEQLLTGWNPPKEKYVSNSNEQYNINRSKFSLCGKTLREDDQWVHNFGINMSPGVIKGKIATGCIYGGRTGYSVKMISAEFIKGFSVRGVSDLRNPFPAWY